MSLSRIVMRLARNPGTEFSGGDDRRGYAVIAPLGEGGALDEAAFKQVKAQCTVRRFAPEEEAAMGHLARRGKHWFFDYEAGESDDDEPVHRLGDHRFALGEYITVSDEDGRPLTYKIVEVSLLD